MEVLAQKQMGKDQRKNLLRNQHFAGLFGIALVCLTGLTDTTGNDRWVVWVGRTDGQNPKTPCLQPSFALKCRRSLAYAALIRPQRAGFLPIIPPIRLS